MKCHNILLPNGEVITLTVDKKSFDECLSLNSYSIKIQATSIMGKNFSTLQIAVLERIDEMVTEHQAAFICNMHIIISYRNFLYWPRIPKYRSLFCRAFTLSLPTAHHSNDSYDPPIRASPQTWVNQWNIVHIGKFSGHVWEDVCLYVQCSSENWYRNCLCNYNNDKLRFLAINIGEHSKNSIVIKDIKVLCVMSKITYFPLRYLFNTLCNQKHFNTDFRNRVYRLSFSSKMCVQDYEVFIRSPVELRSPSWNLNVRKSHRHTEKNSLYASIEGRISNISKYVIMCSTASLWQIYLSIYSNISHKISHTPYFRSEFPYQRKIPSDIYLLRDFLYNVQGDNVIEKYPHVLYILI